jgi:Tol biopolymer transport system component
MQKKHSGGCRLPILRVVYLLTITLSILVVLSASITLAQVDSPIVFTSNRDGNREMYTMQPDGSDIQRLTNNQWEDREPAWSPDRSQIAFASNREGGWGIYTMNEDGSNQRRITPGGGSYYDSPAWSPGGQ